jgi:hypothetical protein
MIVGMWLVFWCTKWVRVEFFDISNFCVVGNYASEFGGGCD